ncbi:type II toxin-antitoxin system VapC family toxin [Salinispirillum marinum]|uniref:Type II toxin-antitoxin system VapC family toxin n=2 Tax=Saccharospirillaceae TaxID=255527 RepID=A0ABV8BJ58_9GAMM
MYLLDTNVVSELRKKSKMNAGVRSFFEQVTRDASDLYLSVITVGELRRGIELMRHRGDDIQAQQLETWLTTLLTEYEQSILPFDREEAQVWGKLRVPKHENALDKQIAATALLYELTVVTRNVKDFAPTGVKLLNPFT